MAESSGPFLRKPRSTALAVAAFLLALAVLASLAFRSASRAGGAGEPLSQGSSALGGSAPGRAGLGSKPSTGTGSIIGASEESPGARAERAAGAGEAAPAALGAIAPSVQALRESALRDPEGTPPMLMRFSIELAQRADAVRSEAEAIRLMDEIEGCVAGEGSDGRRFPNPVQWLCLRRAYELGKRFEGAGLRFSHLRSLASPGVDQLVD